VKLLVVFVVLICLSINISKHFQISVLVWLIKCSPISTYNISSDEITKNGLDFSGRDSFNDENKSKYESLYQKVNEKLFPKQEIEIKSEDSVITTESVNDFLKNSDEKGVKNIKIGEEVPDSEKELLNQLFEKYTIEDIQSIVDEEINIDVNGKDFTFMIEDIKYSENEHFIFEIYI
jgi:hypothetical protein